MWDRVDDTHVMAYRGHALKDGRKVVNRLGEMLDALAAKGEVGNQRVLGGNERSGDHGDLLVRVGLLLRRCGEHVLRLGQVLERGLHLLGAPAVRFRSREPLDEMGDLFEEERNEVDRHTASFVC
jgi:hypothetical protein